MVNNLYIQGTPYSYSKDKIGIFSFTGAENYGSVLQNFALSLALKKIGHNSEQINIYGHRYPDSPFYNFRKKYFNRTEPIFTYNQSKMLNDRYDKIITGSDAIWNGYSISPEMGMLAWASGEKTLISYAASFGEAFMANTISDSAAHAMLKRFDAISVREDSGVEICRKLGVDATHVLDPTLLLDRNDYDNLISDCDINLDMPDNYIFFYDAYGTTYDIMEQIKSRFSQNGEQLLVFRAFTSDSGAPEQFLKGIRNSGYVITNSFHGMCFSIIYNKPFILLHQDVSASRFNSLMRTLGFSRKSYKLKDISPDHINAESPLDYASIEEKRAENKKNSLSFLRNALAIEPSYKHDFVESLLNDNKILGHDKDKSKSINTNQLERWANSWEFDPAMTKPLRDCLHLAIDLKLDTMFYAYETDDPKVLEDREITRALLLAIAKRTLNPEEYAEICTDQRFKLDPHGFYGFILKMMRDKHYGHFMNRMETLKNQPVYFYVDRCGYEIFEKAKEKLKALDIQAYIYVDPIAEGIREGIPVKNFLPFVREAKPLPVIAFSPKPMNVIRLFQQHNVDWEIIPCWHIE